MFGRLASVERRIETLSSCGHLGRLSLAFGPAEKVRLRSLAETGLGEFLDGLAWFSFCASIHFCLSYIFMAVLVHRKMHGSKRPSSNLLLDNVLVYSVLSCAVIFIGDVLGMSVQ